MPAGEIYSMYRTYQYQNVFDDKKVVLELQYYSKEKKIGDAVIDFLGHKL